MTTLRLISSDLGRYSYLQKNDRRSRMTALGRWCCCQGLQASIVYRIGQKIYHPTSSKALRYLGFARISLRNEDRDHHGHLIEPRANIARVSTSGISAASSSAK